MVRLNLVDITTFAKAFTSQNRLSILLQLYDRISPTQIAESLGISRPGIQKHIDMLEAVGLLRREGSGRQTRYIPNRVAKELLNRIQILAGVLKAQAEADHLNETIEAIEATNDLVTDEEFIHQLKNERTTRLNKVRLFMEAKI